MCINLHERNLLPTIIIISIDTSIIINFSNFNDPLVPANISSKQHDIRENIEQDLYDPYKADVVEARYSRMQGDFILKNG